MSTRKSRYSMSASAITGLALVVVLGCAPQGEPGGGAGSPRLDESRLVDLTYAFDSTTVYWPTANSFQQTVISRTVTERGFWYASNDLCASEHGGTHLDAPIHFAEGKWSSEEIPLTRFVGPVAVLDIRDDCAADPDYLVGIEDVLAWEEEFGRLPDGAIVLAHSGWGRFWPDQKLYFGSQTPSDTKTLHFPGFSREVAVFLATERNVDAIGLDTPSLDHGPSQNFLAHQVFGEANIPGFENVANLERLPQFGAWLIALPMKIRSGTGGPTRIVALLPE
jgi:kynurenine formamidase